MQSVYARREGTRRSVYYSDGHQADAQLRPVSRTSLRLLLHGPSSLRSLVTYGF